VFVITDEETVGIGRKSCLSSSRETKKESDVALILADISGRVKRELAKFNWLEIMHDGKDTLLHLAGVFRTEDDHLHTLEVDFNRGCGTHTLRKTVGRELTSVVDDEVWFTKVGELLLGRADQHVMHEEGVVSTGANNPDLNTVLRIPLEGI